MPATIESEFLKRVTKTEGCWFWKGKSVRGNGYGNFGQLAAHRVSYMLFVGPIPDGYDIHHRCRVRMCVNPQHLEALPHHKHIAGITAENAKKTECIHGHPFDAQNTYIRVRDGRATRQCRRCRGAACLRRYYVRKQLCR
jgi:hypothetical protein